MLEKTKKMPVITLTNVCLKMIIRNPGDKYHTSFLFNSVFQYSFNVDFQESEYGISNITAVYEFDKTYSDRTKCELHKAINQISYSIKGLDGRPITKIDQNIQFVIANVFVRIDKQILRRVNANKTLLDNCFFDQSFLFDGKKIKKSTKLQKEVDNLLKKIINSFDFSFSKDLHKYILDNLRLDHIKLNTNNEICFFLDCEYFNHILNQLYFDDKLSKCDILTLKEKANSIDSRLCINLFDIVKEQTDKDPLRRQECFKNDVTYIQYINAISNDLIEKICKNPQAIIIEDKNVVIENTQSLIIDKFFKS